MQADDPAFLPVGTDVSAKYKGAFCEAKIKKVVRNIKVKVTLKGAGAGHVTVSDDAVKGTLRVGNTVEVKLDPKKDALEGTITKIQDCSQYTVVFDDGDITTLRRSALCLKSGRHFAESETLDQLPLTHPEHFGNPVIGSSRRGRRTNRTQSDDSDSETSEWAGGCSGSGQGSTNIITEREPHAGRVVLVQCSTGDKKRSQSQQWFPSLVVSPSAQDTVKIKVKDDYLVRSFKDGRYYTVPKKEVKEFRRNNNYNECSGLEAAILYLDKGVLPAHWDKEILFGQESQSDEMDSEESSDDEPDEEKDHCVAQLYKFMDDRGTPLNRQPTIANKDVDLYRLFKVVQKLGGYNRVTNQNQWKKVASKLGFHPSTTNVTNLCRQAYKRYLHSFEDFYRKLGVTLLSSQRNSRTTGRSLIRDRDKMHSSMAKPASPAPAMAVSSEEKTSEPISKNTVIKTKEKEIDKEPKMKDKESKIKELETKDKETKNIVKEKDIKEKDGKDKENREKENKFRDKEKDTKKDTKNKDVKEKEGKDKIKEKDNNKIKQKEIKIKSELQSSEEDSGDNQPLIPQSIKSEKSESQSSSEKSQEKCKASESPVKPTKIFKSASGVIDGKKMDKLCAKKITHRRNSLPRCTPVSSKGEHSFKGELRCKSSSSDSSTSNKKHSSDIDKIKDKEQSCSSKKQSSSEKNDSDSSSRGSKNGKTVLRRNISTVEANPPSTPGSNSHLQSNKKPRKRKVTDISDITKSQNYTADVGDKLIVYYGPTHSESKVTYEAKVIEIDGKGPEVLLRVHYTGWNTRYDEWIKPSRIANNLTQYSKNKHKEKGKRSATFSGSSTSEAAAKKSRISQSSSTNNVIPPSKPHTRNRSGSHSNIVLAQHSTDISIQSESDTESESDSSEKQSKRTNEDSKNTSEKVVEHGSVSPPVGKEKVLKVSKLNKTSQLKRLSENPQNRNKRTRLKLDGNISPRGRDFDLNEIRSELKGLDSTKKSPTEEISKGDSLSQSIIDDIKVPVKQEKTPEKIAEDIYEFKEPEPFEFEARKSEEKKKRLPPHRLFDDIPPLKLSPNSSIEKLTTHEEKVVPKIHYEGVFDKMYPSDVFHNTEDNNNSDDKERESLSLFSELAEDSPERSLISEPEDSQEPLFIYQSELFSEKSYIPTFKGFTPSKNQETYSKKDAANKIKENEDDFTNSPIKGEQSSDEDPINAAIQRVNEHHMSDDSNDGDLLKTSSVTTVSSGLISAFVSDASESSNKDTSNINEGETASKSKLEEITLIKSKLLKLKPEPQLEKPNSSHILKQDQLIIDIENEGKKQLTYPESSEANLEKNEFECTVAFGDVIMPEPPAGFLIHKEGPSIAEKVLNAINCAKRAATSTDIKAPSKVQKTDANKTSKLSPKIQTLKTTPCSPTTNVSIVSCQLLEIDNSINAVQKTEQLKVDVKSEVQKKETHLGNVTMPKTDLPVKSDISQTITVIKKDVVERRKSIAEPALGGKNNRVLNETIQKLSSQISQPVPSLPLPEYQGDDRSDSTDSDDSDQRLIIDKLSEEESQSYISLSESSVSQPLKVHIEKSNSQWVNVNLPLETCSEVVHHVPEINILKEVISKQEEDSDISSLLCEETIPGSLAPENMIDTSKGLLKSKSAKSSEISFVSTANISAEQSSKEIVLSKDSLKEREVQRENRDVAILIRNERECIPINAPKVDTVMDNTPPTTPESSDGNISPSRDLPLSDPDNQCDMKSNEDEHRIFIPSRKSGELDKNNSGINLRSSPNSPSAGGRRGRRPRGRFNDIDDHNIISNTSQSNSQRHTKYNFFVDLDPYMDGAARIAIITSRLCELRKVYNSLKAELAAIDRRRKKLKRKEKEALKAAKAACS